MRWGFATVALLVTVLLTGTGCPDAPDAKVYFLVSSPSAENSDSYILPLTKPSDIQHARALIDDPDNTDRHIAAARIAASGKSTAYVNRDLLNPPTIWSWHVVEFLGFADTTIEIYDGWPTYVDENLDQWLTETNSTIGFWSYTVTRELTEDEVETGILAP